MDDTKHTILKCITWAETLMAADDAVDSKLETETMIANMLSSRAGWKAVATHIRAAMKKKKERDHIEEANIRSSFLRRSQPLFNVE